MMTLREILNYIDFEMEFAVGQDEYEGERVIRLIDRQRANLGGIESEQFPADGNSAVDMIIDRLEVYWNDYIAEPLARNVDLSVYETYEKIYKANIKDGFDKNDDRMRCLYHIIHPEEVVCVTDLKTSLLADIKDWDRLIGEFGVQTCYQFADDLEEYDKSVPLELEKYGDDFEYAPKIVKLYEGLISIEDFIKEHEQ